MNLEEYKVMYQVEDHHWWYLGMERITCRLLDRMVSRSGQLRILDAGCGTGAVMTYLAKYGQVLGFDFMREALHYCQQRGLQRLAQSSVMNLPFADESFDLITSFDVICQFGVRDEAALPEFVRVLKPNGAVLLRLPAYTWMRGKHDAATHVSHRYTINEVRSKLDRHGLTPERLSYANMFLFPLAAAKRWSERILAPHQTGSDLTLDPGLLNSIFESVLSAEAPLITSIGLPFGLTVIAFARKARA